MAVNGEDIVPGIGKKQAAVLNNESARRLEHERHLEELGFPKYVEPGYMRHAPVSYDDPDNPTPSRIVNQAGQDLGDQNKDESDHFAKNTYKPAKKLAKEAFLEFMSKEDPLPNRSQAELQRTEDLGLSPDATATEIAQAQGQKDLMYRPDLNDPNIKEASYLSGYNPATGKAEYRGFTTDAEGNRVAKDPIAFKGPEGSTFAPPGSFSDAEGNLIQGTGPRGSITFGDIAPKTEDDAGDGLGDISNSIQKSMEIFSNLVMKDEYGASFMDAGPDSIIDGFKNLYDKAKGLFSGDADNVEDSEEVKQLEEDTENAAKDAQDKAKKEGQDFPTYTDWQQNPDVRKQGKDNIIEYLRAINDGKLLIVPKSTGDRYTPKEFQEKEPVEEIKTISYDPDTAIYTENGVIKPIIDGDMSAGGYPASTFASQYGGPRIPETTITIGEGQELNQPEKEKIGGTAMGTTAFQPVDIKTGDPINTAAINAAAKTNEPIKYTLKPVMEAGPNRTAMDSIGLEGSGKSNVFTYVPPPPKGDTQAALNISPDQRMDPAQRTALATAAYNRELAILSGDSKRMAAYGLGPDYKPNVNKSMEKYQAWIQKAEDEGAMAKVQLDRVSDLADMMHDALDEEDQLPGWIQNKISDSLHNLEASFTHIAYDKKQDMELSKSKEMFTNILQKDNHTTTAQVAAVAANPQLPDAFKRNKKGIKGFGGAALNIFDKIYGGNPWIKETTKGKLPKLASGTARLLGAGKYGPVGAAVILGGGGYLGGRAIDAVAPKASDDTRQTIKDMASGFISNPVSFLAGDASAMPKKKDGGLYSTKDITSAIKDFGSSLFKEDISLQKDEGGFDAFGRPTTPAITPRPKDAVRRGTAAELGVTSDLSPQADLRLKRLRMEELVSPSESRQRQRAIYQGLGPAQKTEFDNLAAELAEERAGGKGPAYLPRDFDQRGQDLYRGNISEPGVGEVPDFKPSETAAERIAKIKRMAENPNVPRYRGDTTTAQGALKAGSRRGTIDTMYDQLLDQPKTSLGSGMEQPKAFGKNPTMAYERVSGARGDKFLAPPTKREISEVLDQVADWSQSKVKTAARGALKGKKGLLSALGAAGLGTAFNYLQDKGSDLLGDGGSTRVQ